MAIKMLQCVPFFLSPLQSRFCEIVAIGPKDNSKQQDKELGILESQKINISLTS